MSFPASKVGMPVKALKGFDRGYIKKGEIKIVTIPLKADDLRYWDDTNQKWALEPGKINVKLGSSSEDIKLETTIILKRE